MVLADHEQCIVIAAVLGVKVGKDFSASILVSLLC